MGHFSYLRRMPDEIVFKQGTPFQLVDSPRYFADHVNYYGSKFEPLYVSSAGLDRNWPDRILEITANRLVLYYVIEGKCFFNNEPVQAGEMFFAFPNITHHITQDAKNPSQAWWVTVKGANLNSFLEYSKFQSNFGIRPCERIREIVSYINDMVYNTHFGSSGEAILLANLFHIISIQRYDNSTYPQQSTIRNRYVFEALKYIEDHCMERLTVDDIAQHVHVSPKYLSNIFSKYANCSMRDFILQSKMNVAQSLLKNSKFSVQDVSELLGYSDYFQFSRQFKKHFGKSPNEIRSNRSKESAASKSTSES